MSLEAHKRDAEAFLRAARRGDRATVEALVAPGAKHHNPYFAAGMPSLIDAILAASAAAGPEHHGIEIQRIIAEGELVAVHSRVTHPSAPNGIAVVHLFRFEQGRIAELWDVGMAVPAESANRDGCF